VGIAEVDIDIGCDLHVFVAAHFGALVPGQGLAQVVREGTHFDDQSVPNGFGPVHAWLDVDQHQEPCGPFKYGGDAALAVLTQDVVPFLTLLLWVISGLS
jgi:hypothetical protein